MIVDACAARLKLADAWGEEHGLIPLKARRQWVGPKGELAMDVHAFSTFFFAKLEDPNAGYVKGRLNRWTKKVRRSWRTRPSSRSSPLTPLASLAVLPVSGRHLQKGPRPRPDQPGQRPLDVRRHQLPLQADRGVRLDGARGRRALRLQGALRLRLDLMPTALPLRLTHPPTLLTSARPCATISSSRARTRRMSTSTLRAGRTTRTMRSRCAALRRPDELPPCARPLTPTPPPLASLPQPQQLNGYDCGVFSCHFLEAVSIGGGCGTWAFGQESESGARRLPSAESRVGGLLLTPQ